jgi:hypothetical protein
MAVLCYLRFAMLLKLEDQGRRRQILHRKGRELSFNYYTGRQKRTFLLHAQKTISFKDEFENHLKICLSPINFE